MNVYAVIHGAMDTTHSIYLDKDLAYLRRKQLEYYNQDDSYYVKKLKRSEYTVGVECKYLTGKYIYINYISVDDGIKYYLFIGKDEETATLNFKFFKK